MVFIVFNGFELDALEALFIDDFVMAPFIDAPFFNAFIMALFVLDVLDALVFEVPIVGTKKSSGTNMPKVPAPRTGHISACACGQSMMFENDELVRGGLVPLVGRCQCPVS